MNPNSKYHGERTRLSSSEIRKKKELKKKIKKANTLEELKECILEYFGF